MVVGEDMASLAEGRDVATAVDVGNGVSEEALEVELGAWIGLSEVDTGSVAVSGGLPVGVSEGTAEGACAAVLDGVGSTGSEGAGSSPLSVYTLSELIVQYASAKASGLSRTYSSQVAAF
jgi:hypothetical protein